VLKIIIIFFLAYFIVLFFFKIFRKVRDLGILLIAIGIEYLKNLKELNLDLQ
jgi:hypothetical protein